MAFFSGIPSDINRIIASKLLPGLERKYENCVDYIRSEQNITTLLAYAQVNPDARLVVMANLKYSLLPWYWRNDILIESINCFASELKEIDLSHTHFFSFYREIPALPKLQKARIGTDSEHIRFIKQGKNLTELKILFESDYDWNSIVSTVQVFNLKSLELKYLTDRCQTLQDLSIDELMNLCNVCVNVESLTLKGYVELTAEIEYMISRFQNLKTLCVEGEISELSLPCLQGIPDLEFCNLSSLSLKNISQLGARVKSINGLVASFDDVQELKFFPDLRHLDLQPVGNLEAVLGSVISSVESLNLHLDFNLETIDALPGRAFSFHVLRIFRKLNVPVLIKVLQKANILTSLSLKNIIISAKDVEAILKTVGESLKNFQICIDWQHELAAMRILSILNAVAKYCPNLEDLRFLEDDTDSPMPIFATQMQKFCCAEALAEVSKTARKLKSFDRNLAFIKNRFIVLTEDPARAASLTWDDLIPLIIS